MGEGVKVVRADKVSRLRQYGVENFEKSLRLPIDHFAADDDGVECVASVTECENGLDNTFVGRG